MWALDWQPIDLPELPLPQVWNGPLSRVLGRADTDLDVQASVAPSHSTATTDEGTWDANRERGKISWPTTRSIANRFATYIDESGVEDGKVTRAAAKLPHHVVSADGSPGAAHMAGVRAALARLNQTSGMSEEDRSRARAHLNKHLSDGGGQPSEHAGTRPGAHLEGDRQWYRIQNAHDGGTAAEIDIYDEIGWFGVSASRLVQEIKDLSTSTIRVNINSPGGDMWDGIAIYNALVEHPARVEVKVDALAASAASVIAQAGDHVAMAGASQMMIHDAWGLCAGNASDMEAMAILLNQASDNLAQLYAGTTGQREPEVWRERMRAETWYNADEAVEAGLADEALPVKQRGTRRPEDSFDLTVFNYAGRGEAPTPQIARPADRAGHGATIPTGAPDPGRPQPGSAGASGAPGDSGDNSVDDEPGQQVLAALADSAPQLNERALIDAAEDAGLQAEAEAALDVVDPFHFDPDVFVAIMANADQQAPAPTSRPAPPRELPRTVNIDDLVDAIKEGALP